MLHSSFPRLDEEHEMERAARLIAKLKTTNLDPDDLARAAWPKAVGVRLEKRTRPLQMVRTTLVIEVEDAVWQRQLNAIRGQILKNLAGLLGQGMITELEFRIGVPRRMPQREEMAAQPALSSVDEADRIGDPVFRRLYRESRRAAGA